MAARKNSTKSDQGASFPLAAAIFCGLVGGLVVGASFWIINYWPLPPSVAPYFGFGEGFVWGAVVGFSFGAILGFLTDDSHFEVPEIGATPAYTAPSASAADR